MRKKVEKLERRNQENNKKAEKSIVMDNAFRKLIPEFNRLELDNIGETGRSIGKPSKNIL